MKTTNFIRDKLSLTTLRNKPSFNICTIFTPFLTLFKLMGIMPLSLRETKEKETIAGISRLGYLIGLGLFVLTVVHTLWAPTTLIALEKSAMIEFSESHKISKNITAENNRRIFNSKQTTAVKILHPLLVCVTSLTARAVALSVLTKMLPDLMRKLSQIDRLLMPPEKFFILNLIVLLTLTAVMVGLNAPLMWFHVWQLSFFHTRWGHVWEIFSMINIFTSCSVELQFVLFCYLVRSRFKYINVEMAAFVSCEFHSDVGDEGNGLCQQLRKMMEVLGRRRYGKINDDNPDPKKEVLKLFSKMDEQNGWKYSRRLGDQCLASILTGSRGFGCSAAKLLRSLRSGHILLFEAMEHVNDMYQIQILVSIFASISKILFNLYFSIFGFITSSKSLPTRIQTGQLFIVSLWTIYYCLRYIVLVYSAHLTCKEARKAKKIMCKIDPGRFDPAFRLEVKMFSSHLFGRDFEFSACGFFKLNMSLITSSFSTGITYLVIMAQFR